MADRKGVAFNYDGVHSIKFVTNDGKLYDTWNDFAMAPKTRPYVTEPSVKTNYIDVPGANGSLDYSEVLTGTPLYGNRTGQWDFIVDEGYLDQDSSVSYGQKALKYQQEVLKFFHGKKFPRIILADEMVFAPDGTCIDGWFYSGRISCKVNLGTKDYAQVTLQYNLDPFKYALSSTKTLDWRWNELFNNTIIYGGFSVNDDLENGGKYRTIYMEEKQDVTINVTNPMSVTIRGVTYMLNSGDNLITADKWANGANECVFRGSGLVTIDYSRGRSL